MKSAKFLVNPGLYLVIVLFLGGCAASQKTAPLQAARVSTPIGQRQASIPQVSRQVVIPVQITPVSIPAQAPPQARQQAPEQGHQVMVVTNPTGATISVDGKILGVAPGKISVIRNPNRYGFLPRMTVTATPAKGAKGQYMQSKLFNGYTQTPDLIMFDMTKPQPIPMIEGE